MNKKSVLSIFSAIVFSFVFASCGTADDQMPDPNQGTGGGTGTDSDGKQTDTMSVNICSLDVFFQVTKGEVTSKNQTQVGRFLRLYDDMDKSLGEQQKVPAGETVMSIFSLQKGMAVFPEVILDTPSFPKCQTERIRLP